MDRVEVCEKIKDLVIIAVQEIGGTIPQELNDETVLWGQKGVVDSMGLVNMITDLEEWLSDRINAPVFLIVTAGMSKKDSPFRAIGTLADYALRQAAAAKGAI
ncbi:MAG: hypothetical protein LIQ31_07750 [Planctomycetes bacterium]|nr:hypothetical protein [Planctomycetota bacterium]